MRLGSRGVPRPGQCTVTVPRASGPSQYHTLKFVGASGPVSPPFGLLLLLLAFFRNLLPFETVKGKKSKSEWASLLPVPFLPWLWVCGAGGTGQQDGGAASGRCAGPRGVWWGGGLGDRGAAVLGAGGGQGLSSVSEAREVGRGRGQNLSSSWREAPPSLCGHTALNRALCYVLRSVDLHVHVSCFK